MGAISWGLLGPESIGKERRTRTLNLGATVRSFNDLAVPGMGGVWFGKQLLLATLGVAVAEQARAAGHRVNNIEVANAIESLGCWLALHGSSWQRDARVRGANKMRRITQHDLAFSRVRKPSFYVTQPMRQATIQPLRDLGLIESTGERFNGFSCSELGEEFIEAVVGHLNPSNRPVQDHLRRWVRGDSVSLNTPQLREALSPTVKLPPHARDILRERICKGHDLGSQRRSNALSWVESRSSDLKNSVDWDQKPAMIDLAHWRDIRTGALFFIARDDAILLLDQIEAAIGSTSDRRLQLSHSLPATIKERCQSLRIAGKDFLEQGYDRTPSSQASQFSRECAEPIDDEDIIRNLVRRDGRVLQLIDDAVVPGYAFAGLPMKVAEAARSEEESGAETAPPEILQWPPGISHRVKNLFRMSLDMSGKLDALLSTSVAAEGDHS